MANRTFYIAEVNEDTSFQNETLEIIDKILIVSFDADKSDIRNGVFGFDKFDSKFKELCTSDFSALENEYKPIEVYAEKYYPVWVSMRKGQTITLELDITRRSNYKLFKEIKFEENTDFTFEPTNLKDAKEVKITCNKTSQTPTQIKLVADGNTVGAINFFHPQPKKLALDWRFVELIGNNIDNNLLKAKIKKENLESFLKKSFNPLLIDIVIENTIPNISDLTSLKEVFEKSKIILKNETENYDYINDTRKYPFVGSIQEKSLASATALTLYFIYRRCIKPSEVAKSQNDPESGFDLTGGFSPTGTGVAYMVLDFNGKFENENIIHELLHAVGLRHPFDAQSKHRFKKTKTKNYMDYANTKESTYSWQWQIVQDWINSNSQFTR